jgi:hypothetical protein
MICYLFFLKEKIDLFLYSVPLPPKAEPNDQNLRVCRSQKVKVKVSKSEVPDQTSVRIQGSYTSLGFAPKPWPSPLAFCSPSSIV